MPCAVRAALILTRDFESQASALRGGFEIAGARETLRQREKEDGGSDSAAKETAGAAEEILAKNVEEADSEASSVLVVGKKGKKKKGKKTERAPGPMRPAAYQKKRKSSSES